VKLSDCDGFDSVFREMRAVFSKARSSYDNVTVNYTSGAKTMSAAAVFAGILEEVDWLEVIAGTRKGGIVQCGTEKLINYKTKKLLAEIELRKKLVPLFNMHLYDQARWLLEGIKEEITFENIGALIELVNAYDCWDKFMHGDALEHLKGGIDCSKQSERNHDVAVLNASFSKNRGFLERLKKSDDHKKYEFLIADLINNAERRGEEGKFDDAVARLYRTFEMLAEYGLRRRGIRLDKIDANDLPEQIRDKWKDKIEDGKLEIGLKQKYDLLKDLKDPLGEKYEDAELKELLRKRNYSILAHGLDHVGQAPYEKLLEKVKGIAKEEIPGLSQLQEDAKFPLLNDDDLLRMIGD